jgi:hypothetical protein
MNEKHPPKGDWTLLKDAMPELGQTVWIRGPQLSPIHVRYFPHKDGNNYPCWWPTAAHIKHIGQYKEACEEWVSG